MPRAFIIMLDSFGIGATPDAEKYGDTSANTLLHIAEHCFDGRANLNGTRTGALKIPNLTRLGLQAAAKLIDTNAFPGFDPNIKITGAYGAAKELSLGKDTQSGHWEMAGVPVLFEWGYFSPNYPSFPQDLLNELIERCNLPGVIGNKHASGTVIINELGEEHVRSGKPIVYTSADSVFQIAAHENSFGLEKLYEVCETARLLVDQYNIGRVIARPFIGEPGQYLRTGNRRDYATPPPEETLLDHVMASGSEVITIGKVADIYAHHGVTKNVKASKNENLMQTFLDEAKNAPPGSLTFVNLVDFDMEYGHRRNVVGYAHALEQFDKWLPSFEAIMQPGDLAVITADHGCDPTFPGSDHTREHVPVLFFGPGVKAQSLGIRDTFADIGQTLAMHLGIEALPYGVNVF